MQFIGSFEYDEHRKIWKIYVEVKHNDFLDIFCIAEIIDCNVK